MTNSRLPEIRGEIPGPRSRELAARLRRVECGEVTCIDANLIFWEQGRGSNVFDVDGNRYVDLLAGFGVAALGYAHPELVEICGSQAARLDHAMGDVYPARIKVELLEQLDRVLPADLGSAILSGSGSEAVESALKTALRVTGRPKVLAFEGAYHGLGLGSLDVTHRSFFRAPFEKRLPGQTRFVPFGESQAVREAVREQDFGAILVEPIQGRAGIRLPPQGFLSDLRAIADEKEIMLIVDEVYTGLGRTGDWLACQNEAVVPDLVVLGKTLGAGLPLSACCGRHAIMEHWSPSKGEALHTSTHLGNPVLCARSLRTLQIMQRDELPERARRLGENARLRLEERLEGCPGVRQVRGRGLMIGIELDHPSRASRVVRRALRAGWIVLAEGAEPRTLSLTPALTIPEPLLDAACDTLAALLRSEPLDPAHPSGAPSAV